MPPPSPFSHSDVPGTYNLPRLKQLLLDYLARGTVTSRRIRNILLPACLKNKVLTIEQFRKAFVDFDANYDQEKIPNHMTHVSTELEGKRTILASGDCVRVSQPALGKGQLLYQGPVSTIGRRRSEQLKSSE